MLSFRTAGESHGRGLLVILDGLPAGVEIDLEYINQKLARRQSGYGRGARMKIEKDRIEVISGIRHGRTMGSPIGLLIYNHDWQNWQEVMSVLPQNNSTDVKTITRPRPGHADLAGVLKYNFKDIRNVIERASARETAARTAVGGLTDLFLRYFQVEVLSHVLQIGKIKLAYPQVGFTQLKKRVLNSPLHCFDREKEEELINYIDTIKKEGDSLGGFIEVRTTPLPVGLGSYTQWEQRLDGRLAQAILSIPGVKGVEIGPAFANASSSGSEVHDEIFYDDKKGYYRKTNRAGGLEGGITNGQPLIVRIAMKPIPTLYQPLKTIDIFTKEVIEAGIERSDITAVPAAGIVAEAMVSFVLAQAFLEKFAGDSMDEVSANYQNHLKR